MNTPEDRLSHLTAEEKAQQPTEEFEPIKVEKPPSRLKRAGRWCIRALEASGRAQSMAGPPKPIVIKRPPLSDKSDEEERTDNGW